MARTNTLGNFLTDVAGAIRTKKGSEEPIAAADFDTEIENLPSGGDAITEKDVNFYDYDGTLVNSYTKNEFLALNEMPSNPTHSGLTAQGWNWTLADAKEMMSYADTLDIGQCYKTSDDKLRIYITLQEGRTSPYVSFAVNGTATIDWGDNSTPDTIEGTSTSTKIDTQHSYSTPGSYVINIYSESDLYLVGDSTIGSYLLTNNNTSTYTPNLGYQMCVDKIELSSNCKLNNFAFTRLAGMKNISVPTEAFEITTKNSIFKDCRSLTYITIPFSSEVLTSYISSDCFVSCKSLKVISISKSIGSIRSNAFNNSNIIRFNWHKNLFTIQSNAFSYCAHLISVHLPNTITSLGGSAFGSCALLKKVVLDEGESTIGIDGNSQFSGCMNLREIKISRITRIPKWFTDSNMYLEKLILSDGVITIGENCFMNCQSLINVKIPSSVSTIQSRAFSSIISAGLIDFSEHLSVPTLSNSDAFSGIPSDCKIVVPDNLYEDWIAATNWSTYADYIISKSDWDALQNA